MVILNAWTLPVGQSLGKLENILLGGFQRANAAM
jgi:hypothetical protein